MPRFEFGHLYKFVTSVGLAFIAAAIVFPWFLHQASESLVITSDDLDALTPVARDVLIRRQADLLFFETWQWLISALSACIGIALTIYGFRGWRIRQGKIDKGEDYDIGSKKAQYEALNPAEIKDKEDAEVSESGVPLSSPVPPTAQSSERTETPTSFEQHRLRLREVQRSCLDLFGSAFAGTHSLQRDIKVKTRFDGSAALDGVLVPNKENWGSLLLDISVVGGSAAFVGDRMLRIAYASQDVEPGPLPSGAPGRPPLPLTSGVKIFVFDSEQPERTWTRTDMEVRRFNAVVRQPVATIMISSQRLERTGSDEFRRVLNMVLSAPDTPILLF